MPQTNQQSGQQPSQRLEAAQATTGRVFLSGYVQQQKANLWCAVGCGASASLLMIVQWVLFSFAAHQIIVENASFKQQANVLLVILMAMLGRAFLTRFQTHFSLIASTKVRKHIRQKMLQYWRTASPLYLKHTSAGAYASQFVEDIEAMDGYFARYWPQQALALISPLFILVVVAYLNWLCALLLLISAPLIPLFMVLVGIGAERLNQKYSTIRQRLAGHFLDRVANLSTINLLGASNEVLQEVKEYSDRYRQVVMRTLKVAFLSSTVLEFFTSVAIAALAIYIGFALYGAITWGPADSLTLFSGLAILILAPEFFQPLRTLSQYYHDRASALGAANNLVEAFEFEQYNSNTFNAPNSATGPTIRPLSQYSLVLKDLSIGHAANTPQATHLNAALNLGDVLVVSGQSGSGKSTLLHTLAGYLPALAGSAITPTDTKVTAAYLPQQAWIKNASIRDNLLALAPNASDQEMLDVLNQLDLINELNIHQHGLDTLIGEHNQGLSGGQIQRIAFARLLLSPSPVMLLDEPTARLDTKSKALIIKAMRLLQPSSILVIATHDPDVIALASQHINLDRAGA
ncbi:MAG: thiol reductant ABC exporter subunit CydD [Paraglaciecola sp.]|uniref:thiol reductant ABC exporter subunit CydD n=1 Tax=Paraglaciecola sp. TaxID=1920173 RepID=UPI003297F413